MKYLFPRRLSGICLFIFLFFFGFICSVSLAGPGKIYDDVSVFETNSDEITEFVFWTSSSGYDANLGIVIDDLNGYDPDRFFLNTGNINIIDLNYNNDPLTAEKDVSGILNYNEDVVMENRGDILIHLNGTGGGTNNGIRLNGIYLGRQLQNFGDIDISAKITGGVVDGNTESASIVVAGISSWGSDTIVNKGNITVHAETGAAMSGTSNVFSYSTASGIDCGNVNNTGELRVSSQGGTGVGSVYNLSSAEAIGLSGWSSVLNTGNISVIARGGDSTAPVSQDAYAEAVGIRSKGNIYSEGKISVTAIAGKERPNAAAAYTSSNATAYGILINENGATIHSKGLIQVRATLYPGLSGGVQEARQVYVNDGTTTITGYAMELNTQNGFTTEYAGTIGLNTGAAAYFSDATLYLTLGKNFSGKSEYELPTLVDGAVISDQFAVLSPLPVDYKAGLVNGNGTTPQKIRVEFTPKHSPALKSAQVRNQLSSRMNGMFYSNVLSNILTDPLARPESSQTSAFGQKPEYLVAALGNSFGPLSFVPEKSRDFVFASPIVSTFKNDSATGYEADAIGIMGGVTRALSDRFFFGGHIGITQNEIKFTGQGYDKRSDDTDTYSLGGHAVYLHDDTWLFSYFGTLSYSHSDYQDLATNNKESAAFGSNGFRMDSSLGYRLRAWNQTFLPEMGLAYAWSHQAAFTTDNTSGPNVTHGTMDEHDLYARLGMKWFTQADSKNGWALYPSLGFWVIQALTDAEFSSTMSVGAASRRVTDQEDETTLITEAGITLSNGRTTLSANYNGGYSDNVRNHMFWFEAGISF